MTSSLIDELNNAIKKSNPFNSGLIVRNQDVWSGGFPDVPTLNAHASNTVFTAIEQIQSGERQAVGITMKAEKGLGKSHIISRIRHRLQENGGALFVYMADYTNLNRIKPEFLKTLALSLKQVGSQEATQWQELATALVNEALQKDYAPKQLVTAIPQQLTQQPQLIDRLTQKVLDTKPEIENPDLIQAILWTLSTQHAPYAINWLSGKSLPQSRADQLGLSNSTEEDRDSESFDTVCQILDLISQYNALVVCFDQLEGTETNDAGFTKAQVIANFAMDLYNRIKRGVILTAMYPDIWGHHIRALPTAEAVIDRIGESIVELKYLNSDDVVALISSRLQSFYSTHQLTPPTPTYPFEESKLREFGKQRATARDVLQWCQKNWTTGAVPPVLVDSVELAFRSELASLDDEEFMDDKARIAKALLLGFDNLIGQTIEGVEIKRVQSVIAPKAANKGFIDFKVIGNEGSEAVKIGVCVLPYSNGVGVQAGLNRLIDYEKYDLTRGCLVRAKQIAPRAKQAQEFLRILLDERGGEWALLKAEDIKPLIALVAVSENCADYDLTEEQINDFIRKNQLTTENALLKEILSNPSGQIPENIVDEETIVDVNPVVSYSPSVDEEIDLGDVAA
ncbi:hypothetical protein ACQ4M3_13625 [Leptolyngbya sp. AN03gr2]|uniref:hypothetical protein n=1 Tax=unclassified Leptolyngbya TaxID=2650499 RepID=UPI003D320ED3